MLYGVSLAYKESSNCRMEANYAHQQKLDMIPLQMTQGAILSCNPPSFQSFSLRFRSDRFPLMLPQVTQRGAGSGSSLVPGCSVSTHAISTTT